MERHAIERLGRCTVHGVAEIFVLQHQDDAPAGLLGAFLAARADLDVRTVRVDADELPALGSTADEPARIVVLGADASAVGTGSQGWVAEEVALLRRAALRGIPILGICFGAQTLSAALGGGVHRLERPQIGWSTMATSDPQALPAGPWLSWHEDAVTPPPRATVLAHDDVCVQAYAAGPHLAVQFHPEVTLPIVDGWIDADGRDLADRVYDPSALREASAEHAAGRGEERAAAVRAVARPLSARPRNVHGPRIAIDTVRRMLIPGAPQDDDLLELRARLVADVLPPDTPWFDAHTHIGQHDPDGLTATPDELLAGLDRAGHARALVFPMHEPAGYEAANAEVRGVCAASAGRLQSLVRVDPDHPDALDEVRRGLDAGAVGVKLHPRSDAFALPHPVVDQLAAVLAAAGGGVLLFHAGRGIPALGPSAVAIAERHPQVRLILAHTGVSDLGLVAEPASRLPNLCFDTSWWQVDDMLQMYATIPPGQIHYASDMPYGGGVFASLAMIRCALQAGLSAEAIASIAGGQLQRVLDGEPRARSRPGPGGRRPRGRPSADGPPGLATRDLLSRHRDAVELPGRRRRRAAEPRAPGVRDRHRRSGARPGRRTGRGRPGAHRLGRTAGARRAAPPSGPRSGHRRPACRRCRGGHAASRRGTCRFPVDGSPPLWEHGRVGWGTIRRALAALLIALPLAASSAFGADEPVPAAAELAPRGR